MPQHHVPEILELSLDSEQHLIRALNGEANLPCVLISGSFLDYALAAILKKFLIDGSTAAKLISTEGAIGNFQAKVDLCYALGLIPKNIMQSLSTVGQIRNLFAHQYSKDFDDAEVMKLCNAIAFPSANMIRGVSPRERFSSAAIVLFNCLVMICMQTKKQTPHKPWGEHAIVIDSPSPPPEPQQ